MTSSPSTNLDRHPPDTSQNERQVGIIDLGSNTARLVVFRYAAGQWFQLQDSIRERIRLAEGMSEAKRIQAPARRRAIAALKLFADYAQATSLEDLQVVATSAVREATNRRELLDQIEELGLPVTILSGAEEAEYGVRAVANSLAMEDGFVIDMGGGSMQISQMTRRRSSGGDAYPIGALRLTEKCLAGAVGIPNRSQIRDLEQTVLDSLGRSLDRLRDSDLPVAAMGGTIRSLASQAQRIQGHPIELLHGYRLSLSSLEVVADNLISRRLEDRRSIAGLNPDRADIIVAGALAFRTVMRESGRSHWTISGHGVREGALYRHLLGKPHLVPDVRAFGIENIFRRYAQPELHTQRVVELSLSLFDELAHIHQLDSKYRELLAAAARLHDIGMAIEYNRHHKHGAMLLHFSPLLGFSHREQAIIALLVRFHRKGEPELTPYASLLRAMDRRALPILVICLRLAEQLERSRTGRVEGLNIAVEGETIRIGIRCPDEPAVEIWEAAKHEDLFRRAFGHDLALYWAKEA